MQVAERRRIRPRRRIAPGSILAFGLAAALVLVAPGIPGQSEGGNDEASRSWDLELEPAENGVSPAFRLLRLSGDGSRLVGGTDRGDVLFLDAATGEEQGVLHGAGSAVTTLSVDHSGQRAVAVFEDGIVDVVDTRQGTPLLPPGEGTGMAAALSGDGIYLLIADSGLRLYRAADPPPTVFQPVTTHPDPAGPYLYIHPVLRIFASIDANGNLSVYGFSETGLFRVHGPEPLPSLQAAPVAVTFSQDGQRLATLDEDRNVHRYRIEIDATEPELVLEYETRLRSGIPGGVLLSATGHRIVAWSDQVVLWSEGRNRNVSDEEASATRAGTENLFPPLGAGQHFARVEANGNLSTVLLSQVDPDGRALPHVYAFPGGRPGGVFTQDRVDSGPIAISPAAPKAYGTFGARLAAYDLTAVTYEAPGDAPWIGEDPHEILGFPPVVFFSIGGALILVLLITLTFILLGGSRRAEEQRILAELELPDGPLAPPSAPQSLPRGGSAARAVRPVTPSAPAEAPPPDGILVLLRFTVAGTPRLSGLTLTLARPGVIRMTGAPEHLERFAAAIEGRVPAHGIAAVGGADHGATPVLFARHLAPRLPVVAERNETVRALHEGHGLGNGVPRPIIARRLETDLGWMGPALDAPYGELTAIEQWKVRLALAFLHRPKVLFLRRKDLPPLPTRVEEETIRRVLNAVTRHYGALVLLLDPAPTGSTGNGDDSSALTSTRALAHEEIRLTPQGFVDRALLVDGRPIAAPAAVIDDRKRTEHHRRRPRRAGPRATRKK